MNSVQLRKARTGDETILAYIQTESWKSAFSEILSPEELSRSTNMQKAEEMYRKVLERRFVNLLIESVDGQPLCIAGWSRNRNDLGEQIAELICIHSLSDRRRKGYGSVMMRHILDEIKQAGYAEVILWVFEENLPAIRFYQKHGFRVTEHRNVTHGAVEVMYLKKL